MPLSSRHFALVLAALALLLLGLGAAMTFAGVSAYQAESFLQYWAKRGIEPDPRAWRVALSAAERAQSLYPVGSGDYADRLGRVQSWRSFEQPFGDESSFAFTRSSAEARAIGDSRRGALAAFRAAVRVRPRGADTWVRLAQAKLYLLQFDSEFSEAFSRADALGGGSHRLRLELAQVGLIAWPSLTARQREIALASALSSTSAGASATGAIEQLAVAAGVEDKLCQRAAKVQITSLEICRGKGASGAGVP